MVEMKIRHVNSSIRCPRCESRTRVQVWDYINETWVWWCEECNDPIE